VLEYELLQDRTEPNPRPALELLLNQLKSKEKPYFVPETSTTRQGLDLDDQSSVVISPLDYAYAQLSFVQFINLIIKSSFGFINHAQLQQSKDLLTVIHQAIVKNNSLQSGFLLSEIVTQIHLSFTSQPAVKVHESLKPETVSWLIADINKNPIADKAKFYPDNADFIIKIADYDKNGIDSEQLFADQNQQIKELEQIKQRRSGSATLVKELDDEIEAIKRSKLPIKNKDRSFHYIPYEFSNSNFEKNILEHIFQLEAFQSNQLEVYFNGDRFLSTFKIKIYKKIDNNWKLIQDRYTPDFVIIKRNKKKIEKVLIIETKGAHLSHDFSNIKQFMEGAFLDFNDQAFDFLYLEDGKDMSYHHQAITDKINKYFSNQN